MLEEWQQSMTPSTTLFLASLEEAPEVLEPMIAGGTTSGTSWKISIAVASL